MIDISDLYSWWDEHFEEYRKDLYDYVAIPSVAVKEEGEYPFGKPCYEMLVFISGLMESYGLETRILNKAFSEGIIPSDSDKTVAVACHGDVVPVSGEWDRDPFEMYQKEDHLVGRGTTDNKGAGMAVLYALRYLLSKGWKPRVNVRLLFGSAEEIGMPDYDLAFGRDEKIADLTLVPDSGFPVAYGEKAGFRVSFKLPFGERIRRVSGGSGVGVPEFASLEILSDCDFQEKEDIKIENLSDGWTFVKAVGKGRHSATPEGGVDAFYVLFSYLDNYISDEGVKEYLRLFPDFYGSGLSIAYRDEDESRLTAVVTKAQDGTFSLGVRMPISLDFEKTKNIVLSSLSDSKLESESRGYLYKKNSVVSALNAIANSEYGTNRDPYIMAGGTYARVMQPAIAFGMGSPSGNVTPPFPQGEGRAHQKNESVQIDRMKKGFSIYVKALLFLEEYYAK